MLFAARCKSDFSRCALSAFDRISRGLDGMLECHAVAKIVFMWTPEFADHTLHALAERHTVVGVVTQPDRPAGRGQRVVESPVKQFAHQAGLPVIQPQWLREPEAMAQLAAWAPEIIIVAAFGQILKPAVLDLPPHGCVNVHASLLPRHRGAAPIPAAILSGNGETGVTIMRMDVGLDTGPILAQRAEPIHPDDTSLTLSERLSHLGATLLLDVLPDYLAGTLPAQPQDEAHATYAPQLKKEDGHLDFTQPAADLERRVRAFTPWPGAFARWQDQPIKILRAAIANHVNGSVGEVIKTPQGPAVACGSGGLLLLEVQPPGKKPMSAADFVRGARGFIGARLG
jgi:methionyl-tRNA formyltransferase